MKYLLVSLYQLFTDSMFNEHRIAMYKCWFELEHVYEGTGTGLTYLNHVPCDSVEVEVDGWGE